MTLSRKEQYLFPSWVTLVGFGHALSFAGGGFANNGCRESALPDPLVGDLKEWWTVVVAGCYCTTSI